LGATSSKARRRDTGQRRATAGHARAARDLPIRAFSGARSRNYIANTDRGSSRFRVI
jgi:hypothetical protein